MGDAEVDWEVVEEELSQLPDAWKQARFDSLPHVVDVLTASEGGILDGLREQRDAVEELVDDVVQGYHNGFNRAIHNYSQILRLFSESASKMAGLKTNLGEARRLLAARHKALQQQWYRSITLRHVLQLLDQIDSVAKVPARIERLMLERKYYAATQLLLHSSSMLEREGIQGVGGLRDVRSDMQRLRQGLFTKVMEELHLHIYNQGTYSLASTRIADKDDDARPGQKRSVRKKGSPFSPLRLVGSTDDVRLRLGGTPDRNGRPRGDDHDGAMSEDGSISGSIIASVTGSDIASLPSSILRKSSSQARQQSGQLPIWLTDATPNEFTDSITRADSHDSVKYLQTLVECLALLGKLAAAGSSLAQRLRRTLRELIADVIKARAQAAERARPRVDSIPKTSAGGSPMTFSGASSHGTKMVAHSPRGGFAGGRIGVTSAGMTSAAGGGPTGPASVAAQQLLEEVFGVCVGALENHRLVHTFMQMRGAEDQSARQVLSPPRDENSGDGFKAGGGELAPYNLAVAWSCVQSECQALVCEVLRATPAGVSADPTGLGEGVKEGEKKAGAPGGAAAKEAEGALEGEDEELAFAFRFTDLGSALPGSETGSSTLVRGGDGALQSRSRRASATGQETYETELVLPERGVYLAAAVYRPVVQFTDKAAQIVKDAALKQGGGEALRAWMEKYIANAFLPRVQNDYRGRIADALSSPAAFKPRGRTSETYDRTVEKGRPVLQGGLAAESLVLEVLAWAQALPLFAGQLVGVVQAMLERLLERCRAAYTEAVLGSLSSALAARFDFENLQKRETAFMALFAEPAGGAGQLHVAELEGREEEAEALEEEMFHLIEGQQPIKSEHLIMDFSKVVLLAALSDSLDWLGDVISQLGSGGMTSSSSVVSPVTSPLQERERARARRPPPLSAQHRRGSSQTLTSGLAILADKFHNLSVEFIRTLRLEMQLQTAYHFQDMTDRSYVCDVEPEEPDEYVLSLTTQMSRLDDEVSSYVPPVRRSYAFGGVCGIAARCAIANLGRMKAINHLGVRQVARDCIALQQTLANLGTGGDYASLQRAQAKFDRVRQYYELLTIPVESLIAFAQDHPGAYSPEEFRKLLMVQVPGREVPTDAMHKLVRTFAR